MSNGEQPTYDLGHLPVSWDDLVVTSRNAQTDEELGGLLSVWGPRPRACENI